MTAVPVRTDRAARLPTLIALGVLFWFVAALFIRFVGPVAFVPGSAGLAGLYAATLPIAGLFIWLGALMSGARGPAMLPAFTLMSRVAMLLDGVAIT